MIKKIEEYCWETLYSIKNTNGHYFETDKCKNSPLTVFWGRSPILDLLSLSRSPHKLKKNKSQSEPVQSNM